MTVTFITAAEKDCPWAKWVTMIVPRKTAGKAEKALPRSAPPVLARKTAKTIINPPRAALNSN